MPRPTPSQRFLATVRRTLLGPCQCAPGAQLVVGCSGGPDSVALLLSLCAMQADLDLRLHAVYVDHGLRKEAAAEGQQVLRLAGSLDVPAEVVPVSVPPGASLLARARAARYEGLGRIAALLHADAVAVGHTMTDQSETLLMRLLGGAGLRGLSGMSPQRRLPLQDGAATRLVRPLLRLSREDVAEFLEEAGVPAIQDPTNKDRRYLRSRIRHEVLPLLCRERPDLDRHLSDLCQQLRADADLLDRLADEALAGLLDRVSSDGQQGPVVLPARRLAALPAPLSARVLMRLLGPLSSRHVEQVLRLCQGAGTHAVDLPGGCRAERRYEALHLSCGPGPGLGGPGPGPAGGPEIIDVPAPGTYRLGGTAVQIELHSPRGAPVTSRTEAWFAAEAVPLPLLLRRVRPGDRIQVRGMAGHKKVYDLLSDDKVPRPQRRGAVLLCRGKEVLWVVGHRASEIGRPRGPGPLLSARLV